MYGLDFLIPKRPEPLREDTSLTRVVEKVMREHGYAATADGPLPRLIVDAIIKAQEK